MGSATGIISKAARIATAATTVAGNEFVFADATSSTYTITGPAVGTARRWGVKKTDNSSNAVTISYLNAAGNTATITLIVQDDGKTFESVGLGYAVTAADRSRTQDDLRYAPVNQLGSANNPVTSASAARPTGLTKVFWQCAAQPTNWIAGDEWINNA